MGPTRLTGLASSSTQADARCPSNRNHVQTQLICCTCRYVPAAALYTDGVPGDGPRARAAHPHWCAREFRQCGARGLAAVRVCFVNTSYLGSSKPLRLVSCAHPRFVSRIQDSSTVLRVSHQGASHPKVSQISL
eukprot:6173150-Pleurochrysis_carterae.AAC.1